MKLLNPLVGIAAVLMSSALYAQRPAAAGFEKRFLEMMPQHHESGVEMARVCQQKASHAELKEFCGEIVSTQEQEKQQMLGWRKDWYQSDVGMPDAERAQMMAHHKEQMSKIQAASGNDFDRTFLRLMIDHHRQGSSETKSCMTNAEHDGLKDLCTKMHAKHEQEIATMQKWMESWSAAQ